MTGLGKMQESHHNELLKEFKGDAVAGANRDVLMQEFPKRAINAMLDGKEK